MAKENKPGYDEIVQRLDRIANLMALDLVRDLERDEQIRILSAAGYTPAQIGTFLGVRANTISVALTRLRQKTSNPRAKRSSKQ